MCFINSHGFIIIDMQCGGFLYCRVHLAPFNVAILALYRAYLFLLNKNNDE